MSQASITNSYATGDAKGDDMVGGFAGSANLIVGSRNINNFYIGNPGSVHTNGKFFVDSVELKKIDTFKTVGNYVSNDWDISSEPDPNHIWYISEGQDFPKFYWSYQPVSPSGSGSGTGIWWGLGAVLLIVIVSGIVYVLYFKKK